MKNKTVIEYYFKFDELPPKIITISYEDPIYLFLMQKAIKTNKKITKDEIDKAFKNIDYDLV